MICFSFDTDHMNEVRMQEFLTLVPLPGEGTFFCTHIYECLEKSSHETAPHPLLIPNSDWNLELQSKKMEFPNAKGWRSHSCVFSHILAEWVGKNGYMYVSIHDEFGRKAPQPTRHCWGIWHLPIYYMDNLDFSKNNFWQDQSESSFNPIIIENSLTDDGIYVYDFHPIHLIFNTPNPEYYFSVREKFLKGVPLTELRYNGIGIYNFYLELCNRMEQKNIKSLQMSEALKIYLQ